MKIYNEFVGHIQQQGNGRDFSTAVFRLMNQFGLPTGLEGVEVLD
ncbi:hypothetical protein KI743_22130 [Vibrio sp. D420a]|nr:hypothetical protein [Vibrio sp. D420a]